MATTRQKLNVSLGALDASVTTLIQKQNNFLKFVNRPGALLACENMTGTRGQSVDVRILWDDSQVPIDGIQFDLSLPIAVTFVSVTPGPAMQTAQKQVNTSIVSGNLRVIIIGFNQLAIDDGHLLTVKLAIGQTAFRAFHPLALFGLSFAGPQGNAVPAFAVSGGLTIS